MSPSNSRNRQRAHDKTWCRHAARQLDDNPSRAKLHRINSALSQQELANAAGVSLSTVKRAELRGEASAESWLRLALAMRVPVSEIRP